ncbi:MAG: hypothetical protein HWN68_00260 [Desulfobacterales bacterium]|nr:hypothetical protein [Desulfobacterales bacterium]
MASIESNFMKKNVPRLLSRYELSYYKEDDCIEYFITDKDSKEQISYAIVISLNRNSKEIHVSRFCPELSKQVESKYLSAACFYLLIHHFANTYHLGKDYSISLETRPVTYKEFFSLLKDFDLQLNGIKLCETAEVLGEYPAIDVETSMIGKKIISKKEMPFQV